MAGDGVHKRWRWRAQAKLIECVASFHKLQSLAFLHIQDIASEADQDRGTEVGEMVFREFTTAEAARVPRGGPKWVPPVPRRQAAPSSASASGEQAQASYAERSAVDDEVWLEITKKNNILANSLRDARDQNLVFQKQCTVLQKQLQQAKAKAKAARIAAHASAERRNGATAESDSFAAAAQQLKSEKETLRQNVIKLAKANADMAASKSTVDDRYAISVAQCAGKPNVAPPIVLVDIQHAAPKGMAIPGLPSCVLDVCTSSWYRESDMR